MRKLLLSAAILFSSQMVFANGGVEKKGDPMIAGIVTDATTKKPVADVTITAIHTTSKTEHIISTDANGNFKIAQLPLGNYKFKFEKDNYKPLEKTNITVKQESSTKVNVEIVNYKDEDVEDRKNWLLKFDY
jgi:5-hydroxyisourate hydrolase-like protein (transthyretin family)